jgi:hypothetical protein
MSIHDRNRNRTSVQVKSSLTTAAFRVVLATDQRGMIYCVRKDIPSLRLLFQTPMTAPLPGLARGRIRTLRTGLKGR